MKRLKHKTSAPSKKGVKQRHKHTTKKNKHHGKKQNKTKEFYMIGFGKRCSDPKATCFLPQATALRGMAGPKIVASWGAAQICAGSVASFVPLVVHKRATDTVRSRIYICIKKGEQRTRPPCFLFLVVVYLDCSGMCAGALRRQICPIIMESAICVCIYM